MLIDHKREMINQFEELTRCHRRGLDKSEQLLDEDLELFNKFLDDNKTNSRDAIKVQLLKHHRKPRQKLD
jgi:hypothetical protein